MSNLIHQKNRSRKKKKKNGEKDGKVLYKFMNNAVLGKAMEKLGNRIDARLASKEKAYLKWKSKNYLRMI